MRRLLTPARRPFHHLRSQHALQAKADAQLAGRFTSGVERNPEARAIAVQALADAGGNKRALAIAAVQLRGGPPFQRKAVDMSKPQLLLEPYSLSSAQSVALFPPSENGIFQLSQLKSTDTCLSLRFGSPRDARWLVGHVIPASDVEATTLLNSPSKWGLFLLTFGMRPVDARGTVLDLDKILAGDPAVCGRMSRWRIDSVGGKLLKKYGRLEVGFRPLSRDQLLALPSSSPRPTSRSTPTTAVDV